MRFWILSFMTPCIIDPESPWGYMYYFCYPKYILLSEFCVIGYMYFLIFTPLRVCFDICVAWRVRGVTRRKEIAHVLRWLSVSISCVRCAALRCAAWLCVRFFTRHAEIRLRCVASKKSRAHENNVTHIKSSTGGFHCAIYCFWFRTH